MSVNNKYTIYSIENNNIKRYYLLIWGYIITDDGSIYKIHPIYKVVDLNLHDLLQVKINHPNLKEHIKRALESLANE